MSQEANDGSAPSRQWRRRVILCSVLSSLLLLLPPTTHGALDETDRLQEYKKRKYTWPLPHYVPNTDGWAHIHRRRLEQLERIQDTTPRYNAWMQFITSAFVAPNFTENGWGLTRAPSHLVEELRDSLHRGLADAKPEYFIEVIEGGKESRPLFVRQAALNKKVLRELKPMHEEWAGVPLVGAMAYGLRVYRNNSNLLMHTDKPLTHIISCILHVDHSDDSEPWPIIIEDFQGNTNEVYLESGDMLFYESSKCAHGRPKNFTGSWYSSLFVHYHPVGWDTKTRDLESHYAIPPHWHTAKPRKNDHVDDFVMVGTSFKEPGCKDLWCNLENSMKWYGPAKEGVVMTTGYDAEGDDVEVPSGAKNEEGDVGEEL